MINKREFINILIITLILGFSISFIQTAEIFFYSLIAIFFVILINIFSKKILAFYLDSEIEVNMWEIKRYGFKAQAYFKRPFPAGAFFPIISKLFLFPFNSFVWMASLVFDAKPKIYKAVKRYGIYSFSEMTENQLALIASIGIVTNLAFAIIGYLLNFPSFAKLNLYYAFFNMFPISDLDGNKIFFGNLLLWCILSVLVLIGLLCAIFII